MFFKSADLNHVLREMIMVATEFQIITIKIMQFSGKIKCIKLHPQCEFGSWGNPFQQTLILSEQGNMVILKCWGFLKHIGVVKITIYCIALAMINTQNILELADICIFLMIAIYHKFSGLRFLFRNLRRKLINVKLSFLCYC